MGGCIEERMGKRETEKGGDTLEGVYTVRKGKIKIKLIRLIYRVASRVIEIGLTRNGAKEGKVRIISIATVSLDLIQRTRGRLFIGRLARRDTYATATL